MAKNSSTKKDVTKLKTRSNEVALDDEMAITEPRATNLSKSNRSKIRMELREGDKIRGHISKNGEILLRDVPVEMKKNPQLSTAEKLALQFDVFPPSKPECSVDDVCQFVVNDEQVEVRVIEARPFVGDNFVLCFLYSP